jgi:hypothetical protein
MRVRLGLGYRPDESMVAIIIMDFLPCSRLYTIWAGASWALRHDNWTRTISSSFIRVGTRYADQESLQSAAVWKFC